MNKTRISINRNYLKIKRNSGNEIYNNSKKNTRGIQ